MPHSRILIHFVWTTKNRYPYLTSDKRAIVQKHILTNAAHKDIFIIVLNGHLDHIHCLVSLGNNQNPSEVMRLIKGESSFWINKQKLYNGRFSWQDEFYAISVCEGSRRNVINYIKNQDEHHRKKSFQEEYEDFMKVIESDLLG